jgi:hypothetical protein
LRNGQFLDRSLWKPHCGLPDASRLLALRDQRLHGRARVRRQEMSTTGSDKDAKPTDPVVEPEPPTDDETEESTDAEASPDKRTWQ